MNLLALFVLLLLVYSACYVPGRILVNVLPLDYRVKFALSFGVSYFIYFVFGLFSYIFYIPRAYEFIFLLIFILLFSFYQVMLRNRHSGERSDSRIMTSRDSGQARMTRLLKDEFKLVVIFFVAFIFVICIQGLTPYYSGAESYWDWYEHFARSRLFLDRLPELTRIGGYLLPQRMPLFNAAASYLMFFFGSSYWVFQTISTLFNLSVILPCFLISGLYLNKSVKHITLFLFVIVLLLFHPSGMGMFITSTSTKALAAYYLLLGLYFLLMEFKVGTQTSGHKVILVTQSEAWRHPGSRWDSGQARMTALYIYLVMVSLSFAQLVHVVVLPYIMVIGLFLFVFSIKNKYFIHFIKASVVYLGVVAVWYIWSYKTFGIVLTFFSIRNIELTASLTVSTRISLFLYNAFYSSVPLITKEYLARTYNNVNNLVMYYDRIMTLYTSNIWGATSISIFTSIIATICLKLTRVVKMGKSKIKIRLDYFLFIAFGFAGYFHFLFTATRDEAGGAATMLIPTIYLLFSLGCVAIIKLASKFGKKYILLVTFFIIVESLTVIGFKLYVAKYQLDPRINTTIDINRDLLPLPEHDKYSNFAVHLLNYKLKTDNNLVFLYDKFSSLQTFFLIMASGGFIAAIWVFIDSLTGLSVMERRNYS